MKEISRTTQAILLLVSPLIAGGKTESEILLKPAEYARLANTLQTLESRPCDLLGSNAAELLTILSDDFDRGRLELLLDRGMQLAVALERWQQCSIHVISRADDCYPQRLKKGLKRLSPSLLYLSGNVELLDRGGLAVVGSRNVNPDLIQYTLKVGELAATADYTLISGGAKGVDLASMQGAAMAGGKVIGVLANNLESAVLRRDNRNALLNEDMLLCSPFDPSAGFQAWRAMERNKLIYALADAALVVQSEVGRGGTWSGAREQIKKLYCVPVYTRTAGPRSNGLEALNRLGAHSWPEPNDADDFRNAMEAAIRLSESAPVPQAPLFTHEDQKPILVARVQSKSGEYSWSNEFETKVEELLLRLIGRAPLSAKKASSLLRVGKPQTTTWLEQLVEAGKLTKTSRPLIYQLALTVQGAGETQADAAQNEGKPRGGGPTTRQPEAEVQGLPILAASESSDSLWAAELLGIVDGLVRERLRIEPLSLKAVATQLKVGQFEARSWLGQLVKAGSLEKTSGPVLYQIKPVAPDIENSTGAIHARFDEPTESDLTRPSNPNMNRQQTEAAAPNEQQSSSLAGELLAKVEELMKRLLRKETLTTESVAQALEVSQDQARIWLERLEQTGKLFRNSTQARSEWLSRERQNK